MVYSLDPNQTDSLNQTVSNDLYSFILKSRKIWHLPQEKLAEYKKTYPELDIEAQLRKAAQWLIDNPAKRKTEKGMPRSLIRYQKSWEAAMDKAEQALKGGK